MIEKYHLTISTGYNRLGMDGWMERSVKFSDSAASRSPHEGYYLTFVGLALLFMLWYRYTRTNGQPTQTIRRKVDNTRIQPVGGGHAIEVMAIGIEWVMPHLDDAQLVSLRAVYEANTDIKAFFPKLVPMQAFVFQGTNQFGVRGPDGSPQLEPKNLTPPQVVVRNGGFDLQNFDTEGKVAWVASRSSRCQWHALRAHRRAAPTVCIFGRWGDPETHHLKRD